MLAEPLAGHEVAGSALDVDAAERNHHLSGDGHAELSGRFELGEQDHVGNIIPQSCAHIIRKRVIHHVSLLVKGNLDDYVVFTESEWRNRVYSGLGLREQAAR